MKRREVTSTHTTLPLYPNPQRHTALSTWIHIQTALARHPKPGMLLGLWKSFAAINLRVRIALKWCSVLCLHSTNITISNNNTNKYSETETETAVCIVSLCIHVIKCVHVQDSKCDSRSFTVLARPFSSASVSAVYPSVVLSARLAPASINCCTTASCPLSAAHISAV